MHNPEMKGSTISANCRRSHPDGVPESEASRRHKSPPGSVGGGTVDSVYSGDLAVSEF
jgi:hypothetical protein